MVRKKGLSCVVPCRVARYEKSAASSFREGNLFLVHMSEEARLAGVESFHWSVALGVIWGRGQLVDAQTTC